MWLCLACAAGADPFISEFMADNEKTLRDSFGEYPDWIEIHNPDATPVNLDGWYLTDNIEDRQRWRFPAVTLPAGSNLVVLATGRDVATNGEWHANFELKKSGDYLALVRPDESVASEFTPEYPPQFEDVSYGIARQVAETAWLTRGTSCRWLVPTNNALGHSWRAAAFDDAGWGAAGVAAGYFTNASPDYTADLNLDVRTNMYNLRTSLYLRQCFVVADTGRVGQVTLRLRFDDGFSMFLNGQPAAASNAPAPGSLTDTSIAPAKHAPSRVEVFDLTAIRPFLVPGTNVLATHILNSAKNSSDLFFSPELSAFLSLPEPPQTGYFAEPTPGRSNGGNDTLLLPQTVAFSVASGVFTGSFTLAMSGAETGQRIYFTIDGSVPTTNSSLYAAPVTVSTSRFVRARVFAPNGQAGPPTSAQYTFLDASVRSFQSNLPLLILRNVDPLRPGAVTTQTENIQCFAQVLDLGANGLARLLSTPAVSSRCGVNVRGKSSAGFAKKSYAMEFWDETNEDFKRELLGLPPESDWALISCYSYDRSFLYNPLAFELGRQVGQWAPNTRWVEVFFVTNATKNVTSADYLGLYVLEEKIKISSPRVDLAKLDPWETGVPDCTGGYLFKIDVADTNEFSWTTRRGIPGGGSYLIIADPLKADLAASQIAWFTNHVQTFEDALYGASFTDPALGYAPYLDVAAWIDHHWVNLLSKNPDSLRLSAYMYKDRGARMGCGPLWDFDRCFSSYDSRSTNPLEWFASGGTDCWRYGWWARLFADPAFRQRHIDRWQELRRGPFATTNLIGLVDRMAATVGTSAPARDYARWGLYPSAGHGGSFAGEISYLRNWLSNRVAWIDNQFTPPPAPDQPSQVVTPGFSFDFTHGAGTVYYTLDGQDPRLPDGSLNPQALAYGASIVISNTARVVARALSGTNWSGTATALYLIGEAFARTGDVAVVEVNYRPLDAEPGERGVVPQVMPRHFEFLELQNISAHSVNLGGVTMPAGQPALPVELAPLTLAPGGRALVVNSRSAFAARHGTGATNLIAAEWGDGELADGGEVVTLRDRDGVTIQGLRYNDSGAWPGRADGKGSSLEYAGPDFAAASLTNPANWRASSEIHGTPGAAGLGPDHRVVVNEVLTHTDLPFVDAIELFNPGPTNVDLSGWYLSDSQTPETRESYAQFSVASGTVLPAGGYLVFDETDFNPNGLWNPDPNVPSASEFALDAAHGDDVWLIECDGAGRPARFVDHLEFGAARNGEAMGRWPDGTGDLYPLRGQTLVDAGSTNIPRLKRGAPNADPRVGPLVISEVHYHPTQAGGTAPAFVEIFNAGPTNQDLRRWTLRGDADFDFEDGRILGPGGYLVIVPFDPANAPLAASFCAAYHVATGGVTLAGPWDTNDVLHVPGRVVLNRADEPPLDEPAFHPQILEDDVSYTNTPAWPVEADGGGYSLTRRGSSLIGRRAESWKGEAPSPGAVGPGFAAWLALRLPGGDASGDPDLDLLPNLLEYAAGTDPLSADTGILDWTFEPAGGGLMVGGSYRRAHGRPDAVCTIQQSTNLFDWTDRADVSITNSPDYEIRGVEFPANGADRRLFLRLRVAQP